MLKKTPIWFWILLVLSGCLPELEPPNTVRNKPAQNASQKASDPESPVDNTVKAREGREKLYQGDRETLKKREESSQASGGPDSEGSVLEKSLEEGPLPKRLQNENSTESEQVMTRQRVERVQGKKQNEQKGELHEPRNDFEEVVDPGPVPKSAFLRKEAPAQISAQNATRMVSKKGVDELEPARADLEWVDMPENDLRRSRYRANKATDLSNLLFKRSRSIGPGKSCTTSIVDYQKIRSSSDFSRDDVIIFEDENSLFIDYSKYRRSENRQLQCELWELHPIDDLREGYTNKKDAEGKLIRDTKGDLKSFPIFPLATFEIGYESVPGTPEVWVERVIGKNRDLSEFHESLENNKLTQIFVRFDEKRLEDLAPDLKDGYDPELSIGKKTDYIATKRNCLMNSVFESGALRVLHKGPAASESLKTRFNLGNLKNTMSSASIQFKNSSVDENDSKDEKRVRNNFLLFCSAIAAPSLLTLH